MTLERDKARARRRPGEDYTYDPERGPIESRTPDRGPGSPPDSARQWLATTTPIPDSATGQALMRTLITASDYQPLKSRQIFRDLLAL